MSNKAVVSLTMGLEDAEKVICFDARRLDVSDLLGNAILSGTVPLWRWIGDDHAVTFSY